MSSILGLKRIYDRQDQASSLQQSNEAVLPKNTSAKEVVSIIKELKKESKELVRIEKGMDKTWQRIVKSKLDFKLEQQTGDIWEVINNTERIAEQLEEIMDEEIMDAKRSKE